MSYVNVYDLFQEDRLNLIAGPCSAETEEQVMAVAKELVTMPEVRLFRAGIWKPRTRPNSFDGVGSVGLGWLKKVKEITALPVTVEVAQALHVEECLKNDIDVLWIGARTTANPFMVQEIADSLRGVQIPIIIKNPINPDLQLWIGAMERLHKAGIDQIVALHRGFSVYHKSIYRNPPQWEIPIEMMRLFPDLIMLCDPSHICGNRDFLADIGQHALDLRMKGIMIETHPNPDHAWSDAQQQITPQILRAIKDQWILRKKYFQDAVAESRIEEYRRLIDDLDQELLEILFRRKKVVEQIAEIKERQGVQILQLERWQEILEKARTEAYRLGFDPDFLNSLLTLIHQQAINDQNKIMNSNPKSDKNTTMHQ